MSKPPPAPSQGARKEKEPDDALVRPEHVTELLKWYGPRARYSDLHTHQTHRTSWQNALSGQLTLGEMRHGIRLLSKLDHVPIMTGPQFWKLCKGQTSAEAIEQGNKTRQKKFAAKGE